MPVSTIRRVRPSVTPFAVALILIGVPLAGAAQQTPRPQEPVALEGTMKTFYRAMRTVVVETIDGVQHVFHVTGSLLLHGGKGPGLDALAGMREGSTVVVHYAVEGGEEVASEIDRVGEGGLRTTEGALASVDRRRREIQVRFGDGRTETFRLTDSAAADAARALADLRDPVRVVVYYTDNEGRKLAHYFRRLP